MPMERPRPPFTTWVRATEFRPFPEFLPERPELLQVTDPVGPHFNTVLVATDGKKDDDECRWGVGVVDLYRGLGHYMGGAYLGLDPDLLMRNGELDQATVETLALHGSLTWARKREIVRYEAFRMNGFRPLGREVIFVTDRMATLRTMWKQTTDGGGGRYVQGFERAFSAVAVNLAKLLMSIDATVDVSEVAEVFHLFPYVASLCVSHATPRRRIRSSSLLLFNA